MEDDVFSSRANTTRPSPARIHFPTNNNIGINRSTRTRPDSLSGFTPPLRRGSPLNPHNTNQPIDSQFVAWPVDPTFSSVDPSSWPRRNPSFGQVNNVRLDSQQQDFPLESNVFSDEYDLDPRILQDVQRAVVWKAQREARIKRETVLTPEKALSNLYTVSDRSNTPIKATGSLTSPTRASFSPSISRHGSNRKTSTSTSSDVDFSPATGAFDLPSRSHPIPCSNDNGRTFDWSSAHPDDGDKRWSISIGKKRDKHKLPPLGALMDEQEQSHRSKLAELGRDASPQTIRKADIVSRQLSRRYALIYDSIESRHKALNLASISRWHGGQSQAVKNSLEKAEPFTWIKHLEKRMPNATRSRWNLSALIMEQYISPNELDRMQTIPENAPMLDTASPFPRKSRTPSFLSSSRGGSSLEVGPPIINDGRVSFEPLAEFRRNSLDAMSRKSGESASSSIHSNSPQGGVPILPKSKQGDSYVPHQQPHSPGISSSASSSSSSLFSKVNEDAAGSPSLVVPNFSIHPPSSEFLLDTAAQPLSFIASRGSSNSSQKLRDTSNSNQSVISLTRKGPSKSGNHLQMSSPPPGRSSKKQRANIEETSRREYETKASILQEISAHNHRIRQFLNRISNGLRDYDALQQASVTIPGVNQRSIPKDVLDTFSHDPSAVTGSTRRLQGWRAVEDIHQRIHRQRSILRAFLHSADEDPPKPGCLLDDPIENILRMLGDVEIHKDEIDHGNEEVAKILSSVEKQYAEVKEIYNETASRVSTIYPELSNIIALEESYRDQYQQFWDFGMDALTLLLDTVTPVWRTYGKAIGEDVRDFLIIPLYRNEFTGESKPYPIRGFPRRSLYHCVGLCIFLISSVAVNFLQARAAVTSTLNFRLQWISYDGVRWTALPFFWIAIVIQWLAVVCELAIVFLQLGVIFWWVGWSVRLLT
ncbi:hypothetical protein HYPSUDRAFT_134350 [Hypholoma sublateritium FD-334 SS-4]|uniref:Uncharacterized protein n=1 Tax=Hypholoma sublateritium (strain FD-334 SS-4) TaxID=945553 RepID=A0A0D2PB71_HYPSF|nr:hypothetical protein HYPSUDRAFT_134350 [Hypholoma sublateritium FD-334 SS-4]